MCDDAEHLVSTCLITVPSVMIILTFLCAFIQKDSNNMLSWDLYFQLVCVYVMELYQHLHCSCSLVIVVTQYSGILY